MWLRTICLHRMQVGEIGLYLGSCLLVKTDLKWLFSVLALS